MAVFFYFILVSVAFYGIYYGDLCKSSQKYYFENTLPENKLQDPSVQAIRKRYKNAWFN